jgi:hypothetical protein
MKTNYKIFFLFFLLIISTSFAWGPSTHQYINDLVLQDSRLTGSTIANTIKQYRNYFDLCYMVTDVTVVHYYTQVKRYEATHAWSFQECVMSSSSNPKVVACSYGVASHLIADSISHNNFIPQQIRSTFLPNSIIHPLSEATIEAHIFKNYPIAYERARRSLDLYFEDNEIREILKNCASKQGEFDLDGDLKFFREALGSPGGFFERVFKVPDIYKSFAYGSFEGGLIALLIAFLFFVLYFKIAKTKLFIAFGSFFLIISAIFFAGGISSFTSTKTADKWINMSVERMVYLFNEIHWNERYIYEPTGFAQIQQAEKEVFVVWIIGIVLLLIFATPYLFKKFKILKRR